MRLPSVGVVTGMYAATFLLLGLCMLVAMLVGSRSQWMGLVFIAIFAGGFYALSKLFPERFGGDSFSRIPRMSAARVVVFLLTLAALLACYFALLDASWARSYEGLITAGLVACSALAFNALELRWARQDRSGWTRRSIF